MNTTSILRRRLRGALAPIRFAGLALAGLATFAAITVISAIVPSPALAEERPWTGPSGERVQVFHEEAVGVHGPLAGDQFGFSVATGDFNGDGVDDLATGIPGNDCPGGTLLDCGAVQVRLGFRELGGLVPDNGVFILSPEVGGTPAPAEAFDRAGWALATGDFNGDGLDDLVVGQPDAANATGSVDVYRGSPFGISLLSAHNLRPGSGAMPASPSSSFNFGAAVAVGNFDCDLFDDLAIGYPGERMTVSGQSVAGGSVFVADGGPTLGSSGYRISQQESDIPDTAEFGDRFGAAVAAGDFNGDGCDDLAIGVPEEDGVGAVLVLFGNANSLIFANHYWIGSFDLGVVGNLDDRFGTTLAVGDFDDDGYDDLVIGSPDRDGLVADVGMLYLLRGAPGSPLFGGGPGLLTAPTSVTMLWEDLLPRHQGLLNDRFAGALAVGDFNGDRVDDLAVGTPHNGGVAVGAGQVSILSGGTGGLVATRVGQFWAGVNGLPAPEVSQSEFRFGSALAAGDFDGNGQDDLVVGMPLLNRVGADDGGEMVLYSYLFLDGFERGVAEGMQAWSAIVP